MAVVRASFKSACLKRDVQFSAILPMERMQRYAPANPPLQTLYLLHSYAGSAASWLYNTELDDLAAQNGLAIVMPDGENSFYIDNSKRQDLYGEFLGRELVEFTRGMFPLSDKPEDTILGGVSMGGYGALRNGLKYDGVFGHIIAVSPTMILQEYQAAADEADAGGEAHALYESIFGDLNKAAASDLDLHWLVNKMHREGRPFPDIYIACGYNDMLIYESRRLSGHLNSLGVLHTYEEGYGTHDAAFFNTYLRHALDRLNLDRPQRLPDPFWVEH
jgi:S-formylglutathione hydrolase FrmB